MLRPLPESEVPQGCRQCAHTAGKAPVSDVRLAALSSSSLWYKLSEWQQAALRAFQGDVVTAAERTESPGDTNLMSYILYDCMIRKSIVICERGKVRRACCKFLSSCYTL